MLLYYLKNKRLLFLSVCIQITLPVMNSCNTIPKRHIHLLQKKKAVYDTGLFCSNLLSENTGNLGKCELSFTQI